MPPVSEQLEHAHLGKGLLGQGTVFNEPLFFLPFHPAKRVYCTGLVKQFFTMYGIRITLHYIYHNHPDNNGVQKYHRAQRETREAR